LVLSHSQVLSGLTASTLYHYRVKSQDAAGNLAVSTDSTFTTLSASAGLIAYLKMDEGTGTTAADSSGNGNVGTLVPGATWTTGRSGPAVALDGVAGYVRVPDAPMLDTFPLTAAIWFKTSATTGPFGLVNKYAAGSYNGYQIFISNGNLCAWYLRDAANYIFDGTACSMSTAGYNDGLWHQAALVVDALGGRLYLDGIQKASQPWTGVAGSPTTVQEVGLGHYPGATGGGFLAGAVDELRLYNRALNAAEVLQLFTGLPVANTPGLSINDVVAGPTNAVFTVSLSATSLNPITVVYATADGTATAGTDYVAAAGNLSFTPGTTTQTIPVQVISATRLAAKTFFVNLSTPAGATIAKAQGTGTINAPPAQNVVWTNAVGVSVSGTSLTKTAAAGWNAGASSTTSLLSGDGYVEFTVSETSTDRMLGLSNKDVDQNYTSIGFAAYLASSGALQVYEMGVNRGSFGTYATGDVVRVAVESGFVKYRRNGVLLYSSSAATYPLLVDTSLSTTGATLGNVVVSGNWAAPPPPTAPTNLAATVAGTGQINLSWTNTSTTQTGLKIERSVDNVTFTQITVAGATAVSYSSIGLSASTTYFYRVRAMNLAGDSPYSSTASATTQALLPLPPAPTNLAASAAGSGQINLSWTDTSTIQGGVKVERSTDNVTFTQITVTGAAGVSYSDIGLSASTTYFYRVRATNVSGDSTYSNTASATTQSRAIALVQRNYATPQNPVNVVRVPFNAAQSAGNLNVVVVGWNDTTAQVASVTDTKGNAYQLAVGPTAFPGALTQSIYYARNIAATAAGANTVTVSFSVAAIYPDIRVLEYSGLDAVYPVDATAAATGSTTTSSTPAVVTTHASDLLFAANTVATSTAGAGTGWRNCMITTPDADIAEDRVVSTVGSYPATAPLGNPGPWVMQAVAFKAK
jgi:hypothetical protein